MVVNFFKTIKEDIDTVYKIDPSAVNLLEVILCQPGLHAIWNHRVAHRLWLWKIPVLPRIVSTLSRFFTGVDIHPAAIIGRRFFIEHGTGVVIGETTEIGEDVLLYQEVTLGATGSKKGKRHPTLKNGVIVGAGAKIIGNVTLGEYSKIGAGSVVINDVPDYATVVGVPGRVVIQKTLSDKGVLMPSRMPDPITCELNRLKYEVKELQEIVNAIREK